MKLKESLINEIKKIFKSELRIKVSIKDKIYDYKQWDSLGNFNVLLKCEKYFNIKFSSKEFNNINTFEGLLKIVKKKKSSTKNKIII
jgi:acyl carrier protein